MDWFGGGRGIEFGWLDEDLDSFIPFVDRISTKIRISASRTAVHLSDSLYSSFRLLFFVFSLPRRSAALSAQSLSPLH